MKEIENVIPLSYDLSNIEYIDRQTLVKGIKCNCCGNILDPVLPSNFLKRGKGCSCYNSFPKGEVEIKRWLINNNIDFIWQYVVPEDLSVLNGRTKNSKVIIDFRIFANNKEYWLECNGEQHYTLIPYLHKTREKFEQQLRRDANVKQYCIDNNIQFIEIPIYLITNTNLYKLLDSIFIKNIIPDIYIPDISYNRNKKGDNTYE